MSAETSSAVDGRAAVPAPLTKGVAKLLAREATLREWVEEGRDNYELARAFHVPIGDVRTVVAALNLVRPYEAELETAPDPVTEKRCSFCDIRFQATRYRF